MDGQVTKQAIRERAYQLYLARVSFGSAEGDWLMAEKQLLEEQKLQRERERERYLEADNRRRAASNWSEGDGMGRWIGPSLESMGGQAGIAFEVLTRKMG